MDDQDRTVLRRYFLAIVFVIIIGVIVWLFFFRKDTKEAPKETSKLTDTSQSHEERSPASDDETDGQAGETKSMTDHPTEKPSSGQTRLADTGPGDDALKLFMTTALIGGLARHLYMRRIRPRRSLL